jgi:hypothetical protein
MFTLIFCNNFWKNHFFFLQDAHFHHSDYPLVRLFNINWFGNPFKGKNLMAIKWTQEQHWQLLITTCHKVEDKRLTYKDKAFIKRPTQKERENRLPNQPWNPFSSIFLSLPFLGLLAHVHMLLPFYLQKCAHLQHDELWR